MTETNGNEKSRSRKEEFKLKGSEVVDKIKELIHEGNIRRISIKNDEGKTLMEFPLTLGLVGVAFAPVLAAVGALAALVAKMTLVVEKEEDDMSEGYADESPDESPDKPVEKTEE